MNKILCNRLRLVIALICGASITQGRIAAEEPMFAVRPPHHFEEPGKTFVFDFHGTIADTNLPQAAITWIMHSPIIISHIFYQLLWRRPLVKYLWQHGLSLNYPLKAIFKDASAPAAACQTLRPQVVQAIENLNSQGHRLYIFSGMTPGEHAILSKRHADFFSLFEKVIGTGLDSGVSKHDQKFYESVDELITKDAGGVKSHIVFFDNELENCKRGNAQRWQSVHVTSPDQCADKIAELSKN